MAKSETNIDQIRARIAASRRQVAGSVQGLTATVHPTAVKNQAVYEVKTFASDSYENAKSAFVDESGPRWDRIGTVALAVVGVAVFGLSVRGIVRAFRG
ncbi:DUF3618 domain-containing protein [uncultured Propionibacterium sp.]|uniref:DUF3618 domain-containing protein n=1 Tax=uncultured Propionibacterium sp. TaxID=218066 RepID=UPI00292F4162|nr:DUF3618 domain-containing protein [uncultured Propionibacterium sp.]